MKLRALIISFCILAYITEQVKIPLMVTGNHSKVMCSKTKMKCHKKMAGKPDDNCDGVGCINCPFGSLFTSQSISNTGIVTLRFKKEFVPLKTDLVSGVYREVWRPPSAS